MISGVRGPSPRAGVLTPRRFGRPSPRHQQSPPGGHRRGHRHARALPGRDRTPAGLCRRQRRSSCGDRNWPTPILLAAWLRSYENSPVSWHSEQEHAGAGKSSGTNALQRTERVVRWFAGRLMQAKSSGVAARPPSLAFSRPISGRLCPCPSLSGKPAGGVLRFTHCRTAGLASSSQRSLRSARSH
jgi:hypothetical protein